MIKEQISINDAASIFKLLGDKTRLQMVSLLAIDEICVCEFVDIFQSSQPSISQHLRKLRDKGVVKERKHGQWVYYSLNVDSEYYGLISCLIKELPNPKPLLDELESKGQRVSCC
ncbi:winged helix-turn-helix transcriptional regulator [Paenalkalicoccus suaedae]|uniref:Winged helix-turn-helix transcriptional regulator n=1 Tax=Paenalkalicoccus suaedae TaxID=2592382 RepID=A0A859FFM3_9BACI|nr:metalloregulator ArsR/SmtB family transcription factor [Paenalkalicoccus suaedae]QKS71811.1 winged helix-turn-helix transcriptional regulator [Paenalkalicoccus suaedae]